MSIVFNRRNFAWFRFFRNLVMMFEAFGFSRAFLRCRKSTQLPSSTSSLYLNSSLPLTCLVLTVNSRAISVVGMDREQHKKYCYIFIADRLCFHVSFPTYVLQDLFDSFGKLVASLPADLVKYFHEQQTLVVAPSIALNLAISDRACYLICFVIPAAAGM